MRLGDWVADHGIDAPGPSGPAATCCCAARRGREPIVAGEDALRRRARLGRGAGPQRPADPGTARRRQDLHRRAHDLRARRAGRKVGITALSHKVIRNLLDEVVEAAEAERTPLRASRR